MSSAGWITTDADELAYERIRELVRKRDGQDWPAGLVAYGELDDGQPVFTVTHRKARMFYWLAEPATPWAAIVLRAPAGPDRELHRLLADATVQARLVAGVMRSAFDGHPWPRWPLLDVTFDRAGKPYFVADGASLTVHPGSPAGQTWLVEWDAHRVRVIDEDGVVEDVSRYPDGDD